jgi:two-component system LytT family response regulator
MLRALLIDDEPDARADLRLSLAAHAADLHIVAEAEALDEIEATLARPDYDVVFLDVQLRGATAFDVVPRIRPEARIVFVTGHDTYALRAFEVNALDYLLKPVAPERLAAAVARIAAAFAQTGRHGETENADDHAAVPLRPDDVVYLRTGTQGRFVPLHQISAIEADQNYSVAHVADGSRLHLRRTLKAWEDLLPASHFMRVHRTAIVNLARLTRYERDREEHTLLFIEGVKEPVAATRKAWPELQEKFAQLRRAI